MAEYSRFAKGSFTSTGAAKSLYLPFQPTNARLTNYTAAGTPAQNGVPFAYWDVSMGQGYAVQQVFNATPVLSTDIVTSAGFSTFSAGLALQYGAQIQISGITKASPAVVTTASNHGYSTGDTVIFQGLYQSSTTGMPQICTIPFVITVTGATTFTIIWNTNQSNYTALSASPSGAYVKKVLYPDLYEPGVNYISAITTGTTTTVTTTANHNYVVGQEIAFRIPSLWGTTQLNSLPNTTIPGSPIYGYVTSVTSNTIFVCSINSTGYTAFNSNQTVASVPGLNFPQVVAVGDINSGGPAYSGSVLYPSPQFPTSSGGVSIVGGPGISGAFANNTRQGLIIGAGAGVSFTSSVLVGANGNTIFWEAWIPDFANS
ncbi:MAG: hypothetical protein KGZ39_00330 [Simkania sp.]|nr:hypothetical protein [Simkania sp.]